MLYRDCKWSAVKIPLELSATAAGLPAKGVPNWINNGCGVCWIGLRVSQASASRVE